MNWKIIFEEEFEPEFDELAEAVQNECFAHLKVLEKFGPELGRPHVDTLKGSKYSNMKELRFYSADGVWRLVLLLILPDKRYCWYVAISLGEVRNGFIRISLKRRIRDMTNTCQN